MPKRRIRRTCAGMTHPFAKGQLDTNEDVTLIITCESVEIKNLHFIKTSIFKNLDIGALQESKQEHEQQFNS